MFNSNNSMKANLILGSVLILILFSIFILIYVGFVYNQIDSLILGFFQLFLMMVYFYFYFEMRDKNKIIENSEI